MLNYLTYRRKFSPVMSYVISKYQNYYCYFLSISSKNFHCDSTKSSLNSNVHARFLLIELLLVVNYVFHRPARNKFKSISSDDSERRIFHFAVRNTSRWLREVSAPFRSKLPQFKLYPRTQNASSTPSVMRAWEHCQVVRPTKSCGCRFQEGGAIRNHRFKISGLLGKLTSW